MNRFVGLALFLLWASSASAVRPRSIALTLQDGGRAQISETHDVEPPGPDGLVRIGPLPETLQPASLTASPLERGETLEIVAQRFAFDLLDNDSLFRAHVGQPVVAHLGGTALAGQIAARPDFSLPAPSLVLAAPDAPVRLVPNLFAVDSVEFAPGPRLARTPTVIWQLDGGQAAPAAVQLNYAAEGFSWSASHEAVLADDARSVALSTRVRLKNGTGREFANARLRLALTEKGLHAPLVPDPSDVRASRAPALRYSEDGKSWIPERAAASAAVVATYDLPQPLTLPAGADVYAALSAAASIPAETRYVYDGVRFDRFQRNRRTDWNLGTEFSPVVETRLSFRNEQSVPIPPGEFRLLKGQGNRPLEWIGSDWLPALRPGESATLALGPAAGLSGRRLRTGFTEVVPFKVSEESFEITLDNQSGEDRTITVVEHFYRGETHEITAASAEHAPGDDPHSVRFEVPVKAGTRKSITYTVRYSW